jgi:hypothetical protein
MEIKIKKIGNARGTVGWLSAGFENGTLEIVESTMERNGNHGLWIKEYKMIEGKQTKVLSQFLAAYNQFDLSPAEYDDACTYQVADKNEPDTRKGLWTDAAWETLMKIAQDWCDICNAKNKEEKPLKAKISRIEIKEAANG